jgi:hypothetical protein
MKTALVMTSINVPKVLSLYRAHDSDVMFFVAGDLKTPAEACDFCEAMDNCIYLTPHEQEGKYYKSSKLLGFSTDSRRNYALLEAMRWGAEIIISVDDDMLPASDPNCFFWEFNRYFVDRWHGIQFGAPNQWFNHGSTTVPATFARGLPYDQKLNHDVGFVTDVRIGAVQGTILGVPDADSTYAIAIKAPVHGITELLRTSFVAHPKANAVFNSQITAFRAELAPAFAQFYFAQGRNTDIYASLLMRRIMRERNLYTLYGLPCGYHARQPRPLLKDLQAERYGVDNIAAYADYLNRAPLPKDISVVESCRILAQGWNGPELEAALAFYDDVESILK